MLGRAYFLIRKSDRRNKKGREINRKTKKKGRDKPLSFGAVRISMRRDTRTREVLYVTIYKKSVHCVGEMTYDDGDDDDSCRFKSARKIKDMFSSCFFFNPYPPPPSAETRTLS